MKIKLLNVYWMLAYAFQCLDEREAKEYTSEDFDNVLNLFGKILANGLAKQVKQGLAREYIGCDSDIFSPRGQILMAGTMQHWLNRRKLVSCSVDEYTEDHYANQILKSVATMLIQQPSLDEKVRTELRHVLAFFQTVSTTDLRHVSWNRLNYNRNNGNYRMLIGLCRLIVDGMIVNDSGHCMFRLREFVNNERLFELYEKFLFEFFRKHFPQITVSHSQIDWALGHDNQETELLPLMQSDIMLSYRGKTLIVDAKYYSRPLIKNSRFSDAKPTLNSSNMYQIYTYVKNFDSDNSGNVSGMLLYVKASGPSPDADYMIGGNRISAKTLDMDCPFEDIKAQLFALAEDWLRYALPEGPVPCPVS